MNWVFPLSRSVFLIGIYQSSLFLSESEQKNVQSDKLAEKAKICIVFESLTFENPCTTTLESWSRSINP